MSSLSKLVYYKIYQSSGNTKLSMTKIVHAVKGGLLSYCDKVYSHGNTNQKHRIGGVMIRVLASSAVDHGLESRTGQAKDYNIGVWGKYLFCMQTVMSL
jgi:hypothetical protein